MYVCILTKYKNTLLKVKHGKLLKIETLTDQSKLKME